MLGETMQVEIKAKHISDGVKKACSSCPLALAIREQTGDQTTEVYGPSARFNGAYWNVDAESCMAISDFDEDGCMDVRTVTLEHEGGVDDNE